MMLCKMCQKGQRKTAPWGAENITFGQRFLPRSETWWKMMKHVCERQLLEACRGITRAWTTILLTCIPCSNGWTPVYQLELHPSSSSSTYTSLIAWLFWYYYVMLWLYMIALNCGLGVKKTAINMYMYARIYVCIVHCYGHQTYTNAAMKPSKVPSKVPVLSADHLHSPSLVLSPVARSMDPWGQLTTFTWGYYFQWWIYVLRILKTRNDDALTTISSPKQNPFASHISRGK